ncbi:RHS repeat-associated core domain-containing protein [Thalassomonas haliotis]|nr:RHS repeat-associated core domain-containing protein [Thalassomonas haliotis]
MNGRVYDYNVGRFMSVDPFIQDPGSTQSVNPYSYIMNNPLAGTDPTGYACEKAAGTRSICRNDTNVKNTNVENVKSIEVSGSGNSRSVKVNLNNGASYSQKFTKTQEIGSVSNIAKNANEINGTSGRSPNLNDYIAGFKELWNNASDYVPDIFQNASDVMSENLGGVVSSETIMTGAEGLSDGIVAMSQGNLSGLSNAAVSVVAGRVPFGKKIKSQVDDLLSGSEVRVKSIREADSLLRSALPNAVKVKGAGPSTGLPSSGGWKGKNPNGMYKKDYLIDKSTGRVYGHGPNNAHAHNKHINIKLPSGKKTTIVIN